MEGYCSPISHEMEFCELAEHFESNNSLKKWRSMRAWFTNMQSGV